MRMLYDDVFTELSSGSARGAELRVQDGGTKIIPTDFEELTLQLEQYLGLVHYLRRGRRPRVAVRDVP